MLREIKGNIWDYANNNSVVCILVNGSIFNHRNPMGGGIARECLDRNPDIDISVARCLKNDLAFTADLDSKSKAYMYIFKTKETIYTLSTLDIIEESLKKLVSYMEMYKHLTFLLPRPGCGFGGLDWETEVKPLCEKYLSKFKNYYIFTY